MDINQTAGLAALYTVVELVKFFVSILKNDEYEKKIKDLWEWHNHKDEDGRPIWYVPKSMHEEQEKMIDMIREGTRHQETTARVLKGVVAALDTMNKDGIRCRGIDKS